MTAPTPRGQRNNNPGNIDYNPRNQWQGQLGIEVGVGKPRFARFDTPENGIRALGKLLLNYRGKDGMPGVGKPGIDTPLEFISRWAPSTENNTKVYADSVAKRLGVGARDPIDMGNAKTLLAAVTAIIIHENGRNPYAMAVIEEGVRRAFK